MYSTTVNTPLIISVARKFLIIIVLRDLQLQEKVEEKKK
tara:strand:+ start:3034 stop:3150 length:117 start_codon:yes stop_codon:yes gene_type:complete